MSRSIYNLRLQNGTELLSEIISFEELKELSPDAFDVFTEEDVILAHPIIVHATPYYDSADGGSGLDNVYTPFLTHSKHGCVSVPSDTVLVIDDIHDSMIDQYVELVIAMYGHLYEDVAEMSEPSLPSITLH
jgi:hypothetical protein